MNSVIKKVLFTVAMFNVAVLAVATENIATVEQLSQSIDYAMNKYFSMHVILLLTATVIMLIIAMIFYESYRVNKIKHALRAVAMAKFDFQAEKLNLRLSNAAILKRIVQKTELQDPSSIMKFSYVFEDSLEKYYETEKIESMPNEMLAQISSLRKELGFSPLPRGIALSSTRQFNSGDKCTVQIPEIGQSTRNGSCWVINTDERQWSIARPEGLHVETGTMLHMSMTRQGDAEYAFMAQVRVDLKEELVLYHTNKLNRTQQRNWLRVDVNIPVNATRMEESHVGDILSGKIDDISGGGLRMTLPDRLPKSSMLLLNFSLPGQGQIVDLLVYVVRVMDSPDGKPSKIVHSVAFADKIDLGHEKIMKYVFEKQRETISIRQS